MKILIVGSGNVGGTLGQRWAQAGHTVVFGTRDPAAAKIQALIQASGPTSSATADLPAAAKAAELVLVATPWNATKATVTSLGDLTGKIVVDATNPIGPGFRLEIPAAGSGAAAVQSWANGAQVVKAFNTTGYNNMAEPHYGGESTTMFICGDHDGAKQTVRELTEELGFDVADVGGLNTAHYLEALAMVWINLAMVQGMGREIALKLVTRNS